MIPQPARAGLRRWRRISAAATFREALATKPRARGVYFDILCLPVVSLQPVSPTQPVGSRLGLVVPKRICRSAARRNLIKRLVRESFRCSVPADLPLDCVVRLRRHMSRADVFPARAELAEHWQRVIA